MGLEGRGCSLSIHDGVLCLFRRLHLVGRSPGTFVQENSKGVCFGASIISSRFGEGLRRLLSTPRRYFGPILILSLGRTSGGLSGRVRRSGRPGHVEGSGAKFVIHRRLASGK